MLHRRAQARVRSRPARGSSASFCVTPNPRPYSAERRDGAGLEVDSVPASNPELFVVRSKGRERNYAMGGAEVKRKPSGFTRRKSVSVGRVRNHGEGLALDDEIRTAIRAEVADRDAARELVRHADPA